MARLKILLVTMSVLTLFIMCGGCESEGHDRRDDRWQDKQSEREQLERESERNGRIGTWTKIRSHMRNGTKSGSKYLKVVLLCYVKQC